MARGSALESGTLDDRNDRPPGRRSMADGSAMRRRRLQPDRGRRDTIWGLLHPRAAGWAVVREDRGLVFPTSCSWVWPYPTWFCGSRDVGARCPRLLRGVWLTNTSASSSSTRRCGWLPARGRPGCPPAAGRGRRRSRSWAQHAKGRCVTWTDRLSMLVAGGAIVATLGVGTCSTNARFDKDETTR